MTTSKMISIVLLIALIGSNAFWLNRKVDAEIRFWELENTARHCDTKLHVAVAVIPVVADPESDRTQVISTAEDVSGSDSYEKDGLVWIAGLGLRFNESERVEIATSGPISDLWRRP